MTSRTYAELKVSPRTWREIAEKLKKAGWDHAFVGGGTIDMHGVGLVRGDEPRRKFMVGEDPST